MDLRDVIAQGREKARWNLCVCWPAALVRLRVRSTRCVENPPSSTRGRNHYAHGPIGSSND